MIQSADIKAALRRLYAQPEYALAFEVSDATGGRASRRADAVVMCMWPSRGLAIFGFEIKTHRSDWLRELKKPAKAESIWQFCDEWTLVTAPDVANADEIPDGWGWEVYDGQHLRTMVRPTRRQGVQPSRDFVAAMLRAAGKPDEDEMRATLARERGKIEATMASRIAAEVERKVDERTRDVDLLAEKYRILDAMLPDGRSYLGDDEFAAAVRLVLEVGAVSVYGGLRQLQQQMSEHLARFDRACETLGIPSAEDLAAAHKQALERQYLPKKGGL